MTLSKRADLGKRRKPTAIVNILPERLSVLRLQPIRRVLLGKPVLQVFEIATKD